MRSQAHLVAPRLLALFVAVLAVAGLLVGLAPAHAAASTSCDRGALSQGSSPSSAGAESSGAAAALCGRPMSDVTQARS